MAARTFSLAAALWLRLNPPAFTLVLTFRPAAVLWFNVKPPAFTLVFTRMIVSRFVVVAPCLGLLSATAAGCQDAGVTPGRPGATRPDAPAVFPHPIQIGSP